MPAAAGEGPLRPIIREISATAIDPNQSEQTEQPKRRMVPRRLHERVVCPDSEWGAFEGRMVWQKRHEKREYGEP